MYGGGMELPPGNGSWRIFIWKDAWGLIGRVLAWQDQNLPSNLSNNLTTYTIPVPGNIAWKHFVCKYWYSVSVFQDVGHVLLFINSIKKFTIGNSTYICCMGMKYCIYSCFTVNLCVCWALMSIDGQIFPDSLSGTYSAMRIWWPNADET